MLNTEEKKEKKGKRRFLKVLKITGIFLLVLIVGISGFACWFVTKPWTKTAGTLKVNGLEEPVTVFRDELGIPNIYAENEHDLFFAQGYVTAQDRLFQMEMHRRMGNGTMSEIAGAGGLTMDMNSRTYGLRRIAEASWPGLDKDTKSILEAYCQGINAYIESNSSKLPLEFTIMGFKPEKWEPLDVMSFGNAMAQLNALNFNYELYYTQSFAKLGAEMTEDECPAWDNSNPEIITKELEEYSWRQNVNEGSGALTDELTLLQENFDSGRNEWLKDTDLSSLQNGDDMFSSLTQFGWASGTWAVSGDHTESGEAILACDVHMSIAIPTFWYQIGLHGGRFDVSGFSLPGAPLVMLGRNEDISWGFVNLNADVLDLYVETLDSKEDPQQYLYQGQWFDLERREEVINVKGQEPVVLEYLFTRHGPIINEGFQIGITEDEKQIIADGNESLYEWSKWEGSEPISMRWAVNEGCYVTSAMSMLNRAKNWNEFRTALSKWDALGESFIYADKNGNIGYQSACKIPIREEGHLGITPVSGSDGKYEWKGYIPFEELPSLYNPPTGYVAAINNKTTTDDYPYLMSYDWWHPGYRAKTVITKLEEMITNGNKVNAEDMRILQNDTYSYAAAQMNAFIKRVVPDNALEAKALEYVKAWDGHHDLDSVGAAMYTAWYSHMEANTYNDERAKYEIWGFQFPLKHIQSLVKIMKEKDNKWFDDVNTKEIETRDDIVKKSFKQMVEYLSSKLGDDPSNWELENIQTCTLNHPLLAGIPIVGDLYKSKTVKFAGSPVSVAFAYSYPMPPNDMNISFGSTQKHIVSWDKPDEMQSVIASGQSGNLFHKNRQDQFESWAKGELFTIPFAREAVEKSAEKTLILEPVK